MTVRVVATVSYVVANMRERRYVIACAGGRIWTSTFEGHGPVAVLGWRASAIDAYLEHLRGRGWKVQREDVPPAPHAA